MKTSSDLSDSPWQGAAEATLRYYRIIQRCLGVILASQHLHIGDNVLVTSPAILLSIAAALLVGLIAGVLFGRRSSKDSQRYREVERKLDQVMQDKKSFEDEVSEHFADTARLLNNLTESYREVHTHLAQGAAKLCDDGGPIALGQREIDSDPTVIPEILADVQPPLDYAPKTSPDEKGMLNEEFGLERSASPKDQEEAPRPI